MKKLNKRNQNQNSKIQTLKSISKLQIQNSKFHSGITLIALVVTIVVLLILAGVTITLMFGENNIFKLAKEAGDKTNEAIKSEQSQIDELNKWLTENGWSSENGGSGGSGGSGEDPKDPENPDVPEAPEEPDPPMPSLPEGWDSNKVAEEIKQGDKSAPLPNGFVKSGITEEQSISTGLVIYQIPESEREGIDWTQKTDGTYLDVQKKYNQFVWVPVENPSEMFGTDSNGNSLGKLYNFDATNGVTANNWTETTGENPVMSLKSSTSYREPDILTSSDYDNTASNYTNAGIVDKNGNAITNATKFKEQLQEEFEGMRTSVETYRGFYIGRYETGNLHESTNAYGNTNAVVVRGNTDISATSTSDSKATWYAMYQKSKEVTNNAEIKSSMIWGCQWDATLKWFISSGNKTIGQITSSDNWGNYGDSTNTKKATGSSDTYQANQIYDMAGNVRDWTLEANSTLYRVARGGSCDFSGSYTPASKRGYTYKPTYSDTLMGSRLALYM